MVARFVIFVVKISPASFVALMAPLEEFFMARWIAAEVALLLPPA